MASTIEEKEELAKNGRKKKIFITIIVGLLVCTAALFAWYKVIIPNNKYDKALKLIDVGNNQEAYGILLELGNYKDAKQVLERFKWVVIKKEENSSYNGHEITNYTYDSHGNCIKEVKNHPTAGYDIVEYKYNENQKILGKKHTFAWGDKETVNYSYDESGNCIKEVEENYNGRRVIREYYYDAQGNRIKKISTDSCYGSTYVYVYDYIYDGKGNCIAEKYENSIIKYEYDEKGNCIREEHISNVNANEKGNSRITEYEYDDKGNCTKEKLKDFNGDEKIWISKYDTYGNCYEIEYYNQNGELEMVNKTEYTYDDYGNYIKTDHSDWRDHSVTEYNYQLLYIK